MTFSVPADSYDRFMGRYSTRMAGPFADFAGFEDHGAVLDVGCGPGALLGELIRRVGPERAFGVDPVEGFVEAARDRHPGASVRLAAAEHLPFDDEVFDAALAQLAVHFMPDPVRGLSEMARVTVSGGIVAACVWDFHEGGSPLSTLWAAAGALDPDAPDETQLPGTRRGDLGTLFRAAGLRDVDDGSITVGVRHPDFDDWWAPFELGVGPAGAYVARLDVDGRHQLQRRCRELLGAGPFTIEATAWAARGVVG